MMNSPTDGMYTEVAYQVNEQIATVTLNRPQARNAFTLRMADEIVHALGRADRDPAVRVVILTSAGRDFCVGADLASGSFDMSGDGAGSPGWQEPAGRVSSTIYRMRTPVIAAMTGVAVGAGSTMVLPCDVRVASTDSRFGFVFGRRGIAPEGASTWYLPRLVGLSAASEWLVTGRLIGAEEALAKGLVHYVHEADEVADAARALASDIAGNTAAVSVAVIRRMLWHASQAPEPDALHAAESRLIAELPDNRDAAEGVESFLQRRPPNFPGAVDSDYPTWVDELH